MQDKPEITLSRSLNFPDLEPSRVHNRRARPRMANRVSERAPIIELTHVSARDEAFTPEARAEANSEVARLTVYTLNAILMVIAFPVGLGVLLFNIIGGENLRTTAHVIALTGFAIALSATPLAQALLGGF